VAQLALRQIQAKLKLFDGQPFYLTHNNLEKNNNLAIF
jgi:hypothetical protein